MQITSASYYFILCLFMTKYFSEVYELDTQSLEWTLVGLMPDGIERGACGFVTTQQGRELLITGK